MENITECTNLETKPEFFVKNIATSSLFSLISLYILLALVYHEIPTRIGKLKQIGFLQLPFEKRYKVLSKYTCIFINIGSLVLFVSLVSFWSVESIAIINGSDQTAAEIVCVVFSRINIAALTGGNGLVYLFLWLRQRVIYVHPSLKVLNNKYVSVFSFVVLVLWILFWISLLVVYFTKVQYRFNVNGGCVIHKDSVQPYRKIVFAWTAVSILMQLSLLSLFIFPILKQASWRDQQKNPILMRRVKKAIVFASICFGTDIVTVVVCLLLATDCVANSVIWMYGINLLINHLITIGCFDH